MSLYWFFLFSWFFPSSFILKSLEHPKISTPNPHILIKFTDTRSIAWFRLSLSRNSRTPYCLFKFTIFSISARLAVLHVLSKTPSIAWFRLSPSRNSRIRYCFFKFAIFGAIFARFALLHVLWKRPSIAWFRLSLSGNSRTRYCFCKSARFALLHVLSKTPSIAWCSPYNYQWCRAGCVIESTRLDTVRGVI